MGEFGKQWTYLNSVIPIGLFNERMAVCKIADLDSEIADFVQMLTAIVKLNR